MKNRATIVCGPENTVLLIAGLPLVRHDQDCDTLDESANTRNRSPTRACVQALLMKAGLDVEVAVTALS